MARKVKDVGVLGAFAAGQPFELEITPPKGVLKQLDFYVSGVHATNITTGATDGQVNYFATFRVTVKRKGRADIIWDWLPKNLIHLTAFLEGQRVANANNANDGLSHYDKFSVFLAPPVERCLNPSDWGIHSDDIVDKVLVEGTWGAVTDIGTGATTITDQTHVSLVYEDSNDRPGLCLVGKSNQFAHITDERLGPDPVPHGNSELLAGVMYRQHDNSATAAQRVDGLITRFELDHSKAGMINNELFIMAKKRSGRWSGLAAADLPAGVALVLTSDRFHFAEMPRLGREASLTLIHDAVETVTAEVTNVTPAASDKVYCLVLGVQVSALAARKLGL